MRIAVLALVLAACGSRPDPLYCDESTPCSDPARPYCDLAGEFPASGGVGRTCIPDPAGGNLPDAGPDAAADAMVPVGCEGTDDCSASQPVCRAGTCEPCAGSADDAVCAERDPGAPLCGPEGGCVECLASDQCNAAPRPVCDPETYACRGCEAHDECASGVCERDTGRCAAAASLVYVDFASGSDGTGCGDAPGAAACQTLSGNGGALAKIQNDRRTISMAPGPHRELAQISGLELSIVGVGAELSPPNLTQGSPLRVENDADVHLDGLALGGGLSLTEGVGLSCDGSTVSLREVTIAGNDATGLRATGCALSLVDTAVRDNGTVGIDVTLGTLTVDTSTIADNGFHGLLADGAQVIVRRTLIAGNAAGGVLLDDSSFVFENDVVVHNGNQQSNPSRPVGAFAVQNSSSLTPQTLAHNTFADNAAPVIVSSAGLVCGAVDPVTGTGNIVRDNDLPGGDDPQVVGDCELEYSNVGGGLAGTGNIDEPPTFVAADARDYHLAAGSAGIDDGDPATPVANDLDGDSRPQGARPDIGADERLP